MACQHTHQSDTLPPKYQPQQVTSLKYPQHHQVMYLKLHQYHTLEVVVEDVDEDVVAEVEEVLDEDMLQQYFHRAVMEVFHHQHSSINNLQLQSHTPTLQSTSPTIICVTHAVMMYQIGIPV